MFGVMVLLTIAYTTAHDHMQHATCFIASVTHSHVFVISTNKPANTEYMYVFMLKQNGNPNYFTTLITVNYTKVSGTGT